MPQPDVKPFVPTFLEALRAGKDPDQVAQTIEEALTHGRLERKYWAALTALAEMGVSPDEHAGALGHWVARRVATPETAPPEDDAVREALFLAAEHAADNASSGDQDRRLPGIGRDHDHVAIGRAIQDSRRRSRQGRPTT